MSAERKEVVVLGAGVIGLSVALELHNRGYQPTILARDLPEDSDSVGFASPWAGCNWFPFDADGSLPTSQRERVTFAGLAKLSEAHPELCQKIPFYNVWNSQKQPGEPWYRDLVGSLAILNSEMDTVPGGKKYAEHFESFILHAPKYMGYLGEQAKAKGIKMVRRRVSSLDEAYDGAELVINASGLGAKSLIGVQDDKVYPARGQTVLVRAPWCPKMCVMDAEFFGKGDPNDPDPAYIIPRPGPEGHIVLGGTYIRNDYSTLPDLGTARRILQECHKLLPQLAPEGGSWEDIEVIAHNVGLRPARDGGARIVLEDRQMSSGKGIGVGTPEGRREGRRVGVVHCYGFGSAGFQQSLGAAQQAADQVDEYFRRRP